MELRSIKIKDQDGTPLTQIIEGEGAAESVRNYSGAAPALAYLNERVAYYNQPQAAPEDIGKGREVEEEDGSKALMFGTIQGAVAYLSGQKPSAAPVTPASEGKVDEPKPEAAPAAPEPVKAEAGEEGKEVEPEAPEAPPAAAE